VDKPAYVETLLLGRSHDFIGQVFVGEAERTTQTILDQGFGKTTGELFPFPFSD
jgi:hypothetical protein